MTGAFDVQPARAPSRKWLVGLGIGCGILILLVVMLGIGFALWLRQPGQTVAPAMLLQEDTSAYARWELRRDDPGTEAFLSRAGRALQQRSEQEARLPSFLQPLIANLQEDEAKEDLRQILPLILTWTLRPDPAGDDQHLLSVSVENLANHLVLMDWTLGFVGNRDKDLELHPYQGEKIYVVALDDGGHATFFIRGSELFFTSDLAGAQRAVDRLLAGESPPARRAAPAERLLRDVAADKPLRAALSNEQGELPRTLQRIYDALKVLPPARGTWDPLHALTLEGGFDSDGAVSGKLEILCPDEPWAESHVSSILEELRRLAGEKLQLDLEGRALGDRIQIDFRGQVGVKS